MTTSTLFLLALHVILCGVLWYTVFCRVLHTDTTVRTDVRLAFLFLGTVALMALVAPFVWGWMPSWLSVMLLVGTVVIQGVTAVHWVNGVPDQFVKPQFRQHKRRASDRWGMKC